VERKNGGMVKGKGNGGVRREIGGVVNTSRETWEATGDGTRARKGQGVIETEGGGARERGRREEGSYKEGGWTRGVAAQKERGAGGR